MHHYAAYVLKHLQYCCTAIMHIFHSSSNSLGELAYWGNRLNDMVLSCCSSFIGRAGKDRVSIGVHSFRTSSPNSASLANSMAREPAFFSISSLWFCCSTEAKGCSQGCRRPAGLLGRPDRPGAWPDLSGQRSSLSGRTTPSLSIMQYVRRASH